MRQIICPHLSICDKPPPFIYRLFFSIVKSCLAAASVTEHLLFSAETRNVELILNFKFTCIHKLDTAAVVYSLAVATDF